MTLCLNIMKQKKKLFYVIDSLENSGGSERVLTDRVNYLVENFPYEICIATIKQDPAKPNFFKLDDRIRHVFIPLEKPDASIISMVKNLLFHNYKYELPIIDFIKKEKFDICSSITSVSFLEKNKSLDIKRIAENRFTYKKYLTDEKIDMVRKAWRFLRFKKQIRTQKQMDVVITLTEEDATFYRRYLDNIVVIPNFIDLKNIKPSLLIHKKAVAVGRLEKEKDFTALIKMWHLVNKENPDWKLEIYGEGSMKNELLALINSLQLENYVTIKPPTKDIYSVYESASVYITTSKYEGFGMTILEAMAHGLPIIGFDSVGGVKILVADESNGFVIKDRNIDLLASQFLKLIVNKNLMNKFGKQSISMANEYSIKNIMMKWHELYSKL